MKWWSIGKRRDAGIEDRVVRRLLRAVSAEPGELPGPSPFLMTRLRAAVSARQRSAPHPVGAAAWQMLPAMALLVTVLAAVAGYQSVQASRERSAAVASLMDPRQGGDMLLAAALLGAGDAPPASQGAP